MARDALKARLREPRGAEDPIDGDLEPRDHDALAANACELIDRGHFEYERNLGDAAEAPLVPYVRGFQPSVRFSADPSELQTVAWVKYAIPDVPTFAPRIGLALFDALSWGDWERERDSGSLPAVRGLLSEPGTDRTLPAGLSVPVVNDGLRLVGIPPVPSANRWSNSPTRENARSQPLRGPRSARDARGRDANRRPFVDCDSLVPRGETYLSIGFRARRRSVLSTVIAPPNVNPL